MKFTRLKLDGAFLLEIEIREDERGFFARTFCVDEFKKLGLNPNISQCSTSFNRIRGTLRGMHFQHKPYEEAKLVRCTAGSIYDVILDLRPESPTYLQWTSEVLSADNRKALYIPEGFAHGFQTLEPSSEVLYHMSAPYHEPSAAGARWDDPAFSIQWPIGNPIISERDRGHPLWIAKL